jgi:hypothetical protein
MHRHAILAMIALQAGLAAALAQPAQTPDPAPPPPPPPSMEEPMPGDNWTYEIRDEILGTVKFTRTSVVTEVTPKEISTRFTVSGNNNSGSVIFDRLWNRTSQGDWRYSPNDGVGIKLPLAVGKTWSFKSNNVNSTNGASWTRSGTSKVTAQESMTTRAGTFDVFKIETSMTDRNVANPAKSVQFASETWYAPAINHWVKRTYMNRQDGHLTDSVSDTLTAYGRRQQ